MSYNTREKRLIHDKTYREKNKEKINLYDRTRYIAQREKCLEYLKEYREKNREHLRELCREYYRKNSKNRKGRIRHYLARKCQRLPQWANMQEINKIYKECPIGHHVDHIVPLYGKFVSGLHVEYNLQYLTKEENLAKGNLFPYRDYK